jgi:hypothetical protein
MDYRGSDREHANFDFGSGRQPVQYAGAARVRAGGKNVERLEVEAGTFRPLADDNGS